MPPVVRSQAAESMALGHLLERAAAQEGPAAGQRVLDEDCLNPWGGPEAPVSLPGAGARGSGCAHESCGRARGLSQHSRPGEWRGWEAGGSRIWGALARPFPLPQLWGAEVNQEPALTQL